MSVIQIYLDHKILSVKAAVKNEVLNFSIKFNKFKLIIRLNKTMQLCDENPNQFSKGYNCTFLFYAFKTQSLKVYQLNESSKCNGHFSFI